MGHRITRHLDEQLAKLGEALELGASLLPGKATSFLAEFAPRCQNPVNVETVGRPEGTAGFNAYNSGVKSSPITEVPVWLDYEVRCRRCQPCLYARRVLWTLRAMQETRRAFRTWFSTFTLSPHHHHLTFEQARRNFTDRTGADLDAEDGNAQFRERCSVIGREFTLLLKRLRKNTKAHIRYLIVFERHQNGYPHIHSLIHEFDVINTVKKRELESSWHLGFSHHRLLPADPEQLHRAAGYVTKYIAKELATRIRASLHYGIGNCNGEFPSEAPVQRKDRSQAQVSKANVTTTTHDDDTKALHTRAEVSEFQSRG